ncbi:MAG: PAS domain-containing protein [Verrucomicrobiia bacterium]
MDDELPILSSLGLLTSEETTQLDHMLKSDLHLAKACAAFHDTVAESIVTMVPLKTPPGDLRDRVLGAIASCPPIVTTDRQGRIIGLNTAFTALCGYTLEEVKGRKPGEFLQGPLTDPEDVEALRKAVRRGEPCCQEMVNYHKNGSAYRVRISITPLKSSDGVVHGFSAVEEKLGDVALQAA